MNVTTRISCWCSQVEIPTPLPPTTLDLEKSSRDVCQTPETRLALKYITSIRLTVQSPSSEGRRTLPHLLMTPWRCLDAIPFYFLKIPPRSGARDEMGTAADPHYVCKSPRAVGLIPFTPKLPTSKGIRIDEMSVDPDHIQDHVCLGSLQPGAPEPVHLQLALLLPGLSCHPSCLEAGSSSAFRGTEGSGPGHSVSL